MIKLVIFDFDETLVHLAIDWDSVKNTIIEEAHKKKHTVEQNQSIIVIGNELSKNEKMKHVIDDVYDKYENKCVTQRTYELYPFMLEIIDELKQKNIRMAVASGNMTNTIKAILLHLGRNYSIDLVVGREQVARNKPDPMQLNYIVEKMGVKKEDAVFIGDSKTDEEAANAAGIRFIKVQGKDRESAGKVRSVLGF